MNAQTPRSIGINLAALLALAGLVVSGILLQHHIAVEVGGDPIFEGLCDVSAHSSCDEVLASRWGTVAGVPTALGGFAFFAFMSAWYVVIGWPRQERRWLGIGPLAATVVGVVVSLLLEYVMWYRLKSWCPFCLTTHVLTGLLFLITLVLWFRRPAAPPRAIEGAPPPEVPPVAAGPVYPSLRVVLIAVALAFAVSAAGWWRYDLSIQRTYADGYRQKWETLQAEINAAAAIVDHPDADYQDLKRKWQIFDAVYREAYEKFIAQEPVDIPIAEHDPIRGDRGAPHTVVVFTDFQCPFCRMLDVALRQRLEDYPGHFRIVFKHFPMNTKCNDHVSKTLHVASCAAAVTAEAALLIGGEEAFWQMHDLLFDDPKGFASSSQQFVKDACERLGLDHEQLWAKINSRSTWQRIREDADQGHALGVEATPIIYFDNRRLSTWGDKLTWRYLLQLDDVSEGVSPQSESAPTTRPATRPQ